MNNSSIDFFTHLIEKKMSQQQPTNVYPYEPKMEYGPVIESPPYSSKLPGPIIGIIAAVVIFVIVIVIIIITCLWRRRKDRHSTEAEPQFDQEAPPTGINADEKKPEISSREWFVFEDGSTSHGGGGPAPPNFGRGYGPPPPNFGGGYGPPPQYFYG